MKYKCNDCGHIFESTQTVFECPKCGGINVVGMGGFFSKYKKQITIASAFFTILILFKLCSSSNNTNVNVKFNSTSQKLEVELKGKQIDKYNIIVKRNNDILTSRKYGSNLISFILETPGTYTLQVKYIGSDKMPTLSSYNKGPWIVLPQKVGSIPVTYQTPHINGVRILNTITQSRTHNILILTDTSIVKLLETEFSIDNSIYQSSNIFNNLAPGVQTFYARNLSDLSLVSQFQFNLPEIIVQEPLTDLELNQLLRQIANGDANAFDRWREHVDGSRPIPVSGVQFIDNSYELVQDARTQGKVYNVRTNRNANNLIIAIFVSN